MSKSKKLEIDVSTSEQKEKVFNLFNEFGKICEIYSFFGVKDTPYNNKYIHKIAEEIGFDFSVYKEKKKHYCSYCGKELKNGQKKFCSSSCSAKYNNNGRKHSEETKQKIAKSLTKGEYKEKKTTVCAVCGKELKNRQSIYCSRECFQKNRYNEKIKEWKETPEKFSSEDISLFLRRFLMEKYECKCQKCGWGEVNEITGKVPLQIHHIDGDCTNNKEENLQLLCPNCHSLTPNHGSLNKNSKRYKLKKYKDLIK